MGAVIAAAVHGVETLAPLNPADYPDQVVDLETRPVCGDDKPGPDKDKITPGCCRIYELWNMDGTFYEICKDLNSDSMTTPEVAFLDALEGSQDANGRFTWDNEVSSWRCGKGAEIKLCYDSNHSDPNADCDSPSKFESGHETSGNGKLARNDEVSKVMVWAYCTKF